VRIESSKRSLEREARNGIRKGGSVLSIMCVLALDYYTQLYSFSFLHCCWLGIG
jgi:hypothetical protein